MGGHGSDTQPRALARHGRRFYLFVAVAVAVVLAGVGSGSYALAHGFGPRTGVWTDLQMSGTTPDPEWYSAAYDPQSNKLILFCESGNAGVPGQTWAFDPQAKTYVKLLPSGSPPSTQPLTMVFDESSGKIVCFGNVSASPSAWRSATWSYDPRENTWTEIDPAIFPPTLVWSSMVYHSAMGKVVLLGSDRSGNHMWSYDSAANTWAELTPAGMPPARVAGMMAYDETQNRLVLFGGISGRPIPPDNLLNDTWTYDSTSNTWVEMKPATPPEARQSASIVYDEASGKVVLFGGLAADHALADTWVYDSAADSWTELHTSGSPPARLGAFAFYAESTHQVLLQGGYGRDEAFTDAWAFSL